MKHHIAFLIAMTLGIWACPSLAQNTNGPSAASVYNISGVAVDVTSDSAAKARDQAIAEAQHTAYDQLLERLGVESSEVKKLSNDDLATLVQNFEVHDEHRSAVRYIGTFSVQFRPMAVRNFLNEERAAFNDTQGKPVIVLPILRDGSRIILWEEPTRWFKLWTDATHDGGLIPLIVPTGSAEDKLFLTTSDAVLGKVESIKSLVDKYHADGLVVAVLNGAPDNPITGYVIDVQRFGRGFDGGSPVEHLTLAGSLDKSATDSILAQGIKQIRQEIEKEAKDGKQHKKSDTTESPSTVEPTWTDAEAPSRIPVTVSFGTLSEWADMQRRLLATPGVKRVDIASVNRSATVIELGFEGKPEDIQKAAAEHGLRLMQDATTGDWMLRRN